MPKLRSVPFLGGPGEALAKAQAVVKKLTLMKLKKAADTIQPGVAETVSYYEFPREHWRNVTNNPLERILREVRRRTRVVGAFPDGHSALKLVAARLRHIAGTKWGTEKYLDSGLLDQPRGKRTVEGYLQPKCERSLTLSRSLNRA
jgi:transposase-like protein